MCTNKYIGYLTLDIIIILIITRNNYVLTTYNWVHVAAFHH